MDVVLANKQYNPECFSEIIDDFEDFVKHATPVSFWKAFDDIKKTPDYPEEYLIFPKITTRNMERALAELKNDPECYLKDFDEIKTILEGADLEEKVDEWLIELPCHLYIFYSTIIDILWRANSQRYTTALRDTGKESPPSKN